MTTPGHTLPGAVLSSLRGGIGRPAGRVVAFWRQYRAVAAEALEGQLRRVAIIAAADAFGAASRVLVIGLLAICIDLIQHGAIEGPPALQMLGSLLIGHPADVSPQERMGVFLTIAAAILALLALGSAATYGAQAEGRSLGRAYHRRCVGRLVRTAERLRPGVAGPEPPGLDDIVRGATRNSMHMGRATVAMVGLLQTSINLAFLAVLLLVLDPYLTLLVLGAVVVGAPVMYRVSARIQRDARGYFQEATRRWGSQVGNAARRLDSLVLPGDPPRASDELLLASPAADQYFEGRRRIQLASARMVLFAGLIRALVFTLMFVIFGYLGFEGKRGWGEMFAYLTALIVVATYGQGFLALVGKLNLVHPQVAAYRHTLRVLAKAVRGRAARSRDASARAPLPLLRVAGAVPPHSERALELVPGMVVLWVSEVPAGRMGFAEWAAGLLEDDARAEGLLGSLALALRRRPGPVGYRVEALVGGAAGERFLAALGLANELAALRQSGPAVMDDALWDSLSDRLQGALLMTLLASCSARTVVLGQQIAATLEEQEASLLRGLFADRLVLLAQTPPVARAGFADWVVLGSPGGVEGIWEARAYAEQRAGIERAVPALRSRGLGDDEREEEDLELLEDD